MKKTIRVLLAVLFIFAPPVFLGRPGAQAADIKLTMYVIKATGRGEAAVPSTLEKVKSDLEGTGYSTFSRIRCVGISLPSGAAEDQELAKGYSVNVGPSKSGDSVVIKAKFYKGTKKVFSGSISVSAEKNAMFKLSGVYKGGALIVIFTLG